MLNKNKQNYIMYDDNYEYKEEKIGKTQVPFLGFNRIQYLINRIPRSSTLELFIRKLTLFHFSRL